MDKNITVENLVKLYDEDKTADKKNFYSQLKIESYIPYERKIAIAQAIFNAGLDETEEGFKFNSPKKYFFYCLGVINAYTNINVTLTSNENIDPIALANLMYAEFNAINSRGLFEIIFSKIQEKELTEFNTVLDMVSNDFIENNYSFHGYVDNLINNIGRILDLLSDGVNAPPELGEQNE